MAQDEALFRLSVRAYLATITYVDECIGVVLNAIERSRYRDNTIVVIMGDHGWHLGEKLRYGKATLWSESTKTPLIIRTPEMKRSAVCQRVVNLIDLYPTLIDLCGLPKKDALEGRNISPLVRDPRKEWPFPSITTYNTSFTINDEEWRYTRYEDGTEELYNLRKDPMEWTNLINSQDKPALEARSRLAKWVPADPAPPLPPNKIGNRDAGSVRTPDMSLKATRVLSKLK